MWAWVLNQFVLRFSPFSPGAVMSLEKTRGIIQRLQAKDGSIKIAAGVRNTDG
jgi:hypothetical protein